MSHARYKTGLSRRVASTDSCPIALIGEAP